MDKATQTRLIEWLLSLFLPGLGVDTETTPNEIEIRVINEARGVVAGVCVGIFDNDNDQAQAQPLYYLKLMSAAELETHLNVQRTVKHAATYTTTHKVISSTATSDTCSTELASIIDIPKIIATQEVTREDDTARLNKLATPQPTQYWAIMTPVNKHSALDLTDQHVGRTVCSALARLHNIEVSSVSVLFGQVSDQQAIGHLAERYLEHNRSTDNASQNTAQSIVKKIRAIASLSAKLHSQHINYALHGDLTPDNIYMTDRGHVGIIDFELACIGHPGWDIAMMVIEHANVETTGNVSEDTTIEVANQLQQCFEDMASNYLAQQQHELAFDPMWLVVYWLVATDWATQMHNQDAAHKYVQRYQQLGDAIKAIAEASCDR